MPNKYTDEEIDPRTGTPGYFNLNNNNNAPKIDWSEWRRQSTSATPISQPVGELFEPYGGLKDADEGFAPLDLQDIPEARAQQQGGWELAGKFLGQLGTEATLGMGEAIGYALDFEELANFDGQSREGFDNAFSKYFRDAKESVQDEWFPIYQSRQAQNGDFMDKLTDSTWWASQGKTIGTTLALMAPSLAVGYASGGAGGALVGSMASAMFSRKAESAMEANGVFQQEYNKYLDEGKSDGEARALAGQIAATTFKGNLAMLPLDFMQYATLMKPIGQFAKTLDAAKISNVGKTAAFGFNIASESAEEGYQFTVQNEAIRQTRDGVDAFGAGFGSRLAEYIKDPEFQTSVFMGGVTGGLFDVVGEIGNKVKDKIEANSVSKLIAANLGDVDTFNKIDNKVEADLLVKSINTNQIGRLKSGISSFISEIDASESLDKDARSQMKAKATSLLENAEYIEKADSDLKKSKPEYAANPNVRKSYVLDKYEDKKNSENIEVYRKNLNSEISESNLGADGLTSRKNDIVIAKAKINANKLILSTLKADKNLPSKIKDEKTAFIEKKITDLKSEIEDNIAHVAIQDPSFNLSEYTLPNISNIMIGSVMLGQSELKRDIIRQRLAEFENKTPDELVKEEAEIELEKKQNILNIQRNTFASDVSNITNKQEADSFNLIVNNSGLSAKEKDELKKKSLDILNNISTRQQQTIDNNPPVTPKIIADNAMPQVPVVSQPKIISSNEMPSATAEEVNAALSNINAGDQFTGQPVIAPKLIENNNIPNTPTKVLNEELKTDEVIPVDEDTLNSKLKDEESEVKQREFDKVATSVSVANKAKESIGGVDTYADGKIKITAGYNEQLLSPDYAVAGTKLIIKVDTEYSNEEDPTGSYEATKANIDKVPIKITNQEGELIGHVHTIEWLQLQDSLDPAIKQRLITQTKAIRAFFYENGSISTTKTVSSIVESKSSGWVNLNQMIEVNGKMVRQYKTINEAFKFDNNWDDRVEIITLTGKDSGNIDTVNDKMFKILKGSTVALIPGANGQVITKILKQKKLSEASTATQQEFVHNILGIIYNASYNDVSRDDLFEEVGKYLHATLKSGVDVDKLVYGNKLDLLFNLDLFEGAGKNVTISIRKPNTQNYDVYKVSQVDGKINVSKRINVTSNQFVNVDPKEFESILLNTLGNKYLNLSKKDLRIPKIFTRLVADANYNVSRTEKSDYRDFISETGAASTSVHGVMLSNGNVTYVTQPTISYSSDISGTTEVKPTVKQVVEPIIVQTTTTSVRKSKVIPKGKPSKLDSDDIQSLGGGEVDLSKSNISSFTLIQNVIQENELVGTLVNMYLAEFSESKADAKTKDESVFNSILDEIKAINEDATNGVYYENDAQSNAHVAKYTNILIDNFEPSYNDDGTIKFIGYKTKINLELDRLKFDPLEQSEEDNSEGETQQAQFIDNKNFKEDPEKSASSRIKRGLTSIPLYENGEVKTNLIGTEVYRDYYEVFNTVMEATSDVNIDDIKTEIRDLGNDLSARDGHSFNVYSQINDLLNNAMSDNRDTFYKEFMSVFKKQRTKFIKPIIYSNKEGNPSISLFNSNKSGAQGVLFGKWSEGVKNSKLVNQIKKDLAENKGVSKTFNSLKQRFDKANSKSEFLISDGSYFKEIASIFTELGFSISPEAIEKMSITFYKTPNRLQDLNTKDDNNKKFNNFKSVVDSSFMNLIDSFKNVDSLKESEDEDNDGINNSIFRSQAKYIGTLARFETKVNPSVLSGSFRNGNGDVVYGFVNSHHMANTINDIKNDEAKLRSIRTNVFSQAATWIQNDNLGEVELFYLDAATNGNSKKSAVSFEDMSAVEKEQVKAALVLNKGAKKGYFLTPTPSDKTTFAMISGIKMEIDKNNDLILDNGVVKLKESGDFIDSLYKLFVEPEIFRIEETVQLVKQAISTGGFSNLIKGEHYDIKDKKVVLGSRGYFFMIPQMNEFFKDRINNALTSDHFVVGEAEILSSGELITDAAKRELSIQLNKLHEIKSNQWSNLKMTDRLDVNYKQKISRKIPEAYVDSYAAMDYVVNSMVGYANSYMLITGDPASFVKADKSWDGTSNTWQSMIDGTITNMFKRTAKDIAPGYEGLFDNKKYNVAFISEPERSSRLVSEYEGALKGQIISTLKDIEFADAQEWTTLKEHVTVLEAIGRISKEQRDRVIEKNDNGEEFTMAEMGFVLQPVKPVQVGRKYSDNQSIEYYIKTSSFPLIPQLTRGLEMDAVRVFMEENNIDRLAPKTAVKLGYYNPLQIVNDEGRLLIGEDGKLSPIGFKVAKDGELSDSLHELDRSFFRIQQDVPFDEHKEKILEGSQMKKLKYSDLLSTWEFDLYGKPMHGYELKQLDDDLHTEIYKRNYAALLKKLEATTDYKGAPVLSNFGKLKEILIEEAKERGFDFNDLMLLNTVGNQIGVDGTPLFMHPALPKIEALLNSLIKSKVLVNKLPGKSYVQGSSLGFDYLLSGDQNIIKEVGKKVGIKLLKNFTGELGYKTTPNKDGGESIVAQVMLPWYFAESMDNFINKSTGQVDESKIDPELLKLIGYRIPTQSHGSMVIMEVVGFLPKESGDLLIIPPELSKIMGSDFDVDKLFVHKFNSKFDSGYLNKIIPSSTNVSELNNKELQNLSLDITSSILSHSEITKRLLTALDNNDVANVLSKISELKDVKSNPNETNPNKINFSKASNTSALFDNLHSIFVDINAAGKTGIGVGSVASTSHVLAQYAGMYIKSYKIADGVYFDNAVRFAKTTKERKSGFTIAEDIVKQDSVVDGITYPKSVRNGLYRLDRIYGISGKRISKVIENVQTESVDNAKNQRLFGMNLNSNTFDTALFLAKAGLDEEYIGYFLNQPILVDYVNELNNMSDIGSTEFDSGKKEAIQAKIWDKYNVGIRDIPGNYVSKTISLEEMSDAIAGNVDNAIQLDILESFIAYSDIASKLSRVFRAINTDTKYLGKSLTSTTVKLDEFERDFNRVKGFGNLDNLKSTLQYSAHEYGVEGSSELYRNILPYESEFFRLLRDKLINTSGKDITEDSLNELLYGIKNVMWTTAWADHIGSSDIDIERVRLLFGANGKKSLAIRLTEAQKTSKNTLVKLLNVKSSSVKGYPDVIEFPSAGALEKDFSLKMQQSWMQLYNTNKDLAMDLVSYVMINGNQRSARDFSRFIPIDIFQKEGILDKMSAAYNNVISADNSDEYSTTIFRQFMQHNPNRAFAGAADKFTLRDADSNKTLNLSKTESISPRFGDLNDVEFVYMYDKASYSMLLFERKSGTNVFTRIPTLGNKKALLTEYNLSKPNKASIFVENKPVKEEPIKIYTSIQEVKHESKKDVASTYEFANGVKPTYVMTRILDRGSSNGIQNEGLLELIGFLRDNYGDLLNTIDLVSVSDKSQMKGSGRWGEIDHSDNVIRINFSAITPMSKGNEWGFPASTADEFFALVFAHELLHKVTKTKEKSPELMRLFDVFVSEYSGNSAMSKYTKDVDEFLSGLFTDKNLQAKLNQVKVGEKSLFDKIWDAIKKMISGDIEVKPGSLLEKSMEEAFKLIAPEQKKVFDFKSAINMGVDLEIGEEFIPDVDYGDLDIQSLLEFNFSEADMKEAEEVDKYCNGVKGKFGKIKK